MKTFLIIIFSFSLSLLYSQNKSKYLQDTLSVRGVCDMCETRIENNLDIVGVKSAAWNAETQLLTIRYNPKKITLTEIHQRCADVGHSTSKIKASTEAYSNLHHCCKYKETEPHHN